VSDAISPTPATTTEESSIVDKLLSAMSNLLKKKKKVRQEVRLMKPEEQERRVQEVREEVDRVKEVWSVFLALHVGLLAFSFCCSCECVVLLGRTEENWKYAVFTAPLLPIILFFLLQVLLPVMQFNSWVMEKKNEDIKNHHVTLFLLTDQCYIRVLGFVISKKLWYGVATTGLANIARACLFLKVFW